MSSLQRRADEGYLTLLALRHQGYKPDEIARMCGVTSDFVRSITTRIRRADRDESGEDIDWAYWPEPRRAKKPAHRDSWIARARKMLRDGYGVEDIAVETGAPIARVRHEAARFWNGRA